MRTHKNRPASRYDLDDGDAFVPDYRKGIAPLRDGDAEAFGDEFIAAATSGDAIGEIARDETYAEELGGFVFDTLYDDDIPDNLLH